MALNIKNERVVALAREAADKSGKSQVGVIEAALLAYLEEHLSADPGDRECVKRRARIDATLADLRAVITDEDRARMQQVMDEMYDPETGLPA